MAMNLPAWQKREKFRQVWDRGRGKCFYCECVCSPRRPAAGYIDPRMGTIDHIIPRSRGGNNRLTNLVLACFECNNSRGNADAYAFMVIRKRRLSNVG